MDPEKRGATFVEYLIPVGLIAGWIILQAWVLPKMGIAT